MEFFKKIGEKLDGAMASVQKVGTELTEKAQGATSGAVNKAGEAITLLRQKAAEAIKPEEKD